MWGTVCQTVFPFPHPMKLQLQYFGHQMRRAVSLEKSLLLRKIAGGRRRGRQEDKMGGWHYHRDNGHECEQTRRDSEGQGSLVCYSPWGHDELDTTERLNNSPWEPHGTHEWEIVWGLSLPFYRKKIKTDLE